MNYDYEDYGLYRHKVSDTVKWVLTLIAFVIVGVMLAGIICGWFVKDEEVPVEDEQQQTEEGGELVVGDGISSGVFLMSARIAVADFEEYGISPLAESAQQVTASVQPSDALNKEVDWSIAWANASSAWAKGKTVTDYVTVTPTSNGALTANVECKQAFGEQIKVTVTSRENANATASCMVDYAQRVTGMAAGHVFSMWNTTSDSEVELSEFAGFLSEEDMMDSFFCIPSFSDVYTKADD